MQRTLPQPGFWLSVGLVAIAVSCQALLASPFQMVDMVLRHSGSSPLNLVREPIVLGIINIISFGVAIGLGLLFNRMRPRGAFPLTGISPLAWVGVVFVFLGGGVLLSEVDNIFRWLVPVPEFIANLMADMFFGSGRIISMFFLLCLVAPVTEEILFRGLILRGLLRRFRAWPAIFLSSMLFAVMHLNPWQTITAFGLGVIFGWYYHRTGSLWPCIIGHALNNLMVVVIGSAPFGLWESPTAADLMTVEFQPWWLDGVGLLLLLAGVWLFQQATRSSVARVDLTKPPLLKADEIPPVLPA